MVGLGGVVLNSAVFCAFVRERQNMARPVNVLVWWVVVYLHCSLQHSTMCRMQTLYCFLYSAISIHWRSYVMYTGTPLFFDLDVVNAISFASMYNRHNNVPCKECVVMNLSCMYLYTGHRVYEASMCLVRYWFVRSSLQVELQETFNNNTFIYKILLIPQEIFELFRISN